MVSKILVALCVLVVVTAAIPARQAWAPSGFGRPGGWGGVGGVNPWIPAWAPCTTLGSDCLDCTTKVVCTKVGGIERACSDPTLPYCNLGECSATPSAECAAPVPISEDDA